MKNTIFECNNCKSYSVNIKKLENKLFKKCNVCSNFEQSSFNEIEVQ